MFPEALCSQGQVSVEGKLCFSSHTSGGCSGAGGWWFLSLFQTL